MNDFTKEELQEIKRCLKYMIKGGTTPYSSLTIGINKKIQSLIDNYCEPHWNELQIATINKIKSMLNDCRHIDIIVRHNGEDKRFEGDFLKDILRNLNDNQ